MINKGLGELYTFLNTQYRPDFSFELGTKVDEVAKLTKSGVSELILCDQGKISSPELAYVLAKRYQVASIALRGGFYLVETLANRPNEPDWIVLRKILPLFKHITILKDWDFCREWYPTGLKYINSKRIHIEAYKYSRDAEDAIAERHRRKISRRAVNR